VGLLLVAPSGSAAVSAGVDLAAAFTRVSDLVRQRHAAGEQLSAADLAALFDAGDALERAAREQFGRTLADPLTPPG